MYVVSIEASATTLTKLDHASYAVISLIFIANALGFITAGPICHILNNKFGRAIVLSASAALNVVAAILLVIQPPFAVIVIAFYLLGKPLDLIHKPV